MRMNCQMQTGALRHRSPRVGAHQRAPHRLRPSRQPFDTSHLEPVCEHLASI